MLEATGLASSTPGQGLVRPPGVGESKFLVVQKRELLVKFNLCLKRCQILFIFNKMPLISSIKF